MNAVRDAKIKLGVDPLGGAGIDYWPRIAEQYGLDLTIVNRSVDPTFRIMTVDWDGKIRMDPSSPYAMRRLIAMRDKFDIAFASDTDHDRHGIATKGSGLLPPNHYLSACVGYLFANRPNLRREYPRSGPSATNPGRSPGHCVRNARSQSPGVLNREAVTGVCL